MRNIGLFFSNNIIHEIILKFLKRSTKISELCMRSVLLILYDKNAQIVYYFFIILYFKERQTLSFIA